MNEFPEFAILGPHVKHGGKKKKRKTIYVNNLSKPIFVFCSYWVEKDWKVLSIAKIPNPALV